MVKKEIILEDGDSISFTNITPNYGRAEFTICPVFKRGKLIEMYMYPMQQEDMSYYYKIDLSYHPIDFSITSLTQDNPRIWIHSWCKEHKCHSFSFYVPKDSNRFRISKLSNFSIIFERSDEHV